MGRRIRHDDISLDRMIDLGSMRLVVIHDSWVGYSDISPIVRSYVLRPGPSGELAGNGHYTTGRGVTKDAAVTVPAGATQDLLAALAGAVLRAIPYVPYFDHTDDYPRIEIAIQAHSRDIGRGGGLVLLHTTSQGEGWGPWAVSVEGATYVVEGDAIGRAYATMTKSLERDLGDE